jgi:hypothetical protein
MAKWWYQFTFYIACFILGMLVLMLTVRFFGDRIDDTRARTMIGAHGFMTPGASLYVLQEEVKYIGRMDSRCWDCGGPGMDILIPGSSHISILSNEQGTYVHCLAYSNSSKPWSDSGVQWWGDAWTPLTVDLSLTDELLADNIRYQIDDAVEAGAFEACKLTGASSAPWDGTDDIDRLIVRALR